MKSSILRLEELLIDYRVSLEMFDWIISKLIRLSHLSLGHPRQRYSQHSSVMRMTPSRWETLLHTSHLNSLIQLNIPVLFQPEDADPHSQVCKTYEKSLIENINLKIPLTLFLFSETCPKCILNVFFAAGEYS